MAGRKPKPTALKLVQGNPGKRAISKDEPKPTEGAPDCPSWLSPKAKTAFRELCGTLGDMGILTIADKKGLELLCEAYSEWRDARAAVKKHGMTYEATTASGDTMVRPRPEVSIASDAWKRVRAALVEFGLTPSARTKVQANKPEEVDPMEEFLGRKKG